MSYLPKVLSETPDLQNGKFGIKYVYADGSVGFKPHDSKYLFVTAQDGSKTTYEEQNDSSFNKTTVKKANGEIEFYFNVKIFLN